MKFTESEISLFEYISFSLSEEIDIFYCFHSNSETFSNKSYNEQEIKEKLLYLIEILENFRDGPRFKSAL